jgi:hypothetical protein
MNLNRKDFLIKVARMLMASILAVIAIALGSKVAMGNDCSQCPGNGVCRGEADCKKYLSK